MFRGHVSRYLAAHLDGELPQSELRRVEAHLNQCQLCHLEHEQVRQGMEALELLPTVEAPDAIWLSIEARLRERRRPSADRQWRWAFAATIVLILASAGYWALKRGPATRWEVRPVEGSPSIGAKRMNALDRIGAGQWIETDGGSRASIKVGEIGSVEIEPDTRVRVVAASEREHRLALAKGEIRAKISAPPKLFFVETASGTAIDLGCEYSLKTDENGDGLLRVTKGWVSFEWKGLESLVPAGANCKTRQQIGPGLPYFEDAPEPFRQALDQFDVKQGYPLAVILTEARVRDTLTLWHLLSRVDERDREAVFNRMAALVPLPAGVSRELALKLDPATLTRWKEELAWTW